MCPKKKFKNLFNQMYKLCEKEGWGDPFSYARSKEILAACELGHDVAKNFSGPDAIGPNGEEYEYKSSTKKVQGNYSGVSVQGTWEEQEKYLKEVKIAKYPLHYYNYFDEGKLVESWEVDGDIVHDILLPKFKNKYPTVLSKKDPRLSAQMTEKEVKTFGRPVILDGVKVKKGK